MKDIAVAIDFNPAQSAIVQTAGELARSCNSKLHLVHVCKVDSSSGLPAVSTNEIKREHELEKERDELRGIVDELRSGGIDAHGYMKSDKPVKGILEFAEHRKAGLIVIGSHSRISGERFDMGHVADGVVRNSKIPVVLIPPPMAG